MKPSYNFLEKIFINSKKAFLQKDFSENNLQTDLSETLGVPVSFSHSENGRGKLTIKYNSLDELDGILDHIK